MRSVKNILKSLQQLYYDIKMSVIRDIVTDTANTNVIDCCDLKRRKCYISVIGSWCDRCKFFPVQVDRVYHPLNLHEPKVKDPFSRGFQPMQLKGY